MKVEINMTFSFDLPHPTSATFLFHTISALPSQIALPLTAPTKKQPTKIPQKSTPLLKTPPRSIQESPHKSCQKSKFGTFVKEFSEKKPSKKTRNISRGQIQKVNPRRDRESVTLFEEIKISKIPETGIKKIKKPIPGKKAVKSSKFVKKWPPVTKNFQIISKSSPTVPKSITESPQKIVKSSIKKNILPISIKKRKFSTSPVGRLSLSKPWKPSKFLSKPRQEVIGNSFQSAKTDEIEALIDVDRRTVIFEQSHTSPDRENADENTDLFHPLHQITWYQETNIEDIESAIDEVVEIMEEIKKAREIK
jgi:hypothetical protein